MQGVSGHGRPCYAGFKDCSQSVPVRDLAATSSSLRVMTRLVLVHGAAVGPSLWDGVLSHLTGFDVLVPERPRTGDLARELDWLADLSEGAWVVGISGGATLGLALTATGMTLAGAVLHEPAVGSLVPGLLAPMAAAFEQGGTVAFARELYGPSWAPMAGAAWLGDEVTARELAMFRSFEPTAPRPEAGRVVTTVGTDSPPVRGEVARALRAAYGIEVVDVPGASHFAPHDAAAAFANVLREIIGPSD